MNLYISGLFKDVVDMSDRVAPNGIMINEYLSSIQTRKHSRLNPTYNLGVCLKRQGKAFRSQYIKFPNSNSNPIFSRI